MTRIISGRFGGRTLATPKGGNTRPTTERVREALFSRLEHLDVLAGASVLDLYAGSGALGFEALSRGATSAVLVEAARSVAAIASRNAKALGCAPDTTIVTAKAEKWVAGLGAAAGGRSAPGPDADEMSAETWAGGSGASTEERSEAGPEARAKSAEKWAAALGAAGERSPAETEAGAMNAADGAGDGRFSLVITDPPYDVDEATLAGVLAGLAAPGVLAADAVVVVERSSRSPEPTWPAGLSRFDERTYGETRLWFAELHPSGTNVH